jgi:hypothetical protein
MSQKQTPFNEHLLWKSKANYPRSVAKPPMILPNINSLTGKEINPPDIHSEMNKAYAAYSRAYWLGVERRRRDANLIR